MANDKNFRIKKGLTIEGYGEAIDSAGTWSGVAIAYADLSGTPTNLSSFTNDTNYLDSNTVTGVIDATYVQSNQTTYSAGSGIDLNGTEFTVAGGVGLTAGTTGLSITNGGVGTTQLADDAVTYAKIQNVVGNNVFLGNDNGAGAAVQELTAAEARTILNVEDGATADQTAAEIMALIQTLDSNSSGLNADTLDGQQGTYYLNAANFTGTLPNNFVTLGTMTTGNYVATISGTTNEIEVTGSGSETAAVTIGLPNDVTIGNNLTVTGNLTVSGTTTTVNTETINLADNIITLNSNATGVPSQNSGMEIERGDSANVVLRYNEANDRWEFTNNGTNYYNIPLSTEYNNYSHPNHTGDVTSVGDGATTIANNAVTHAKYQQVATDTIIGRTAAGTGNVTALTAAEVRGIINVADGAATGTVTSVGGTGTVSGLTLTGTVTTSGNLTLGGTLSGVTSSNFSATTTLLIKDSTGATLKTIRGPSS